MKPASVAKTSLVHSFVEAAILAMVRKNITNEERHVVHTDLVPKFSQKVIEEHVKRGPQVYQSIESRRNPVASVPQTPSPIPPSPLPSQAPIPIKSPVRIRPVPVHQNAGPSGAPPMILASILNDPSVVGVECPGEDQPLTIMKHGNVRQSTNVRLSESEITKVLQDFSDRSHVPLMEGVFRVLVDGFEVNAVISELIGSKFVIRKIPGG